MSKYYYKFLADSKEGKLLRSFYRAAQKAEIEAEKYAKKVGAVSYYEDSKGFAGGVSAVVFSPIEDVNPDIWKYVGTQEENGDRLYVPNVTVSVNHKMLTAGEIVPRDSARRIWQDVRPMEGDGERVATYLEITPNAQDASKSVRARAVQAEHWRLKLPIVRTGAFYHIVHADTSVVDTKRAPVKVIDPTPVFYLYHGYYYIGLAYPINREGFKEITQYNFNVTKRELLFEEKMKQN